MLISLNKPIDSSSTFWGWGDDIWQGVFSLDTLKQIFAENDDNKVEIHIHSLGGNLSEAFSIYDYLRESGREISCHIDGNCSSSAFIVLLAAPKERRTASPNAGGLFHEPYFSLYGDYTVEQLENLTMDLADARTRYLNICAERTGTDYDTLDTLMGKEQNLNTEQLINYGFISGCTTYISAKAKTLKINNKMSKRKTSPRVNSAFKRFARIRAYDHLDEAGNLLFSTESDSPELFVGQTVSVADGSFTLPDGAIVIVTDYTITNIVEKDEKVEPVEPVENAEDNETAGLLTALQAEVEDLKTRVETLEAENIKLREELESEYQPAAAARRTSPKATPKTKNDYIKEAETKC